MQVRVVREITGLARRENLKSGEHLPESLIAARIGVSRTPVNAALKYLVGAGMLTYDQNRGYFLGCDSQECSTFVEDLFRKPDEPLYLQIAEDRVLRKLPDVVSESDLMRRYSVPRGTLKGVLSRIQQEGWIERQLSNSFRFLPLIDSPQAYEESYLFRAAIEPAGVLASSFQFVSSELEALLERQRFIVEGGFKSLTPIELFEANSDFHEALAGWSRNRFTLQAVRRINHLRRLVEYRQAKSRLPRQEAATEHVAILNLIAKKQNRRAANLLRKHLEAARHNKVSSPEVFG